MGSFIFTWEHPADEVYVTGTFDDWSKSESLEKTDTIFAKRVFLTNVSEKIYYKFVVDGNWVTDHTAPQENDESGNLNNVLTADRITMQTFDTVGNMSGTTPESTSVQLAAAVPIEKGKRKEPDTLPGTFPETPAAEGGLNEFLMNKQAATEISAESFNPKIKESLDSHSDNTPVENKKEQNFGVSPLPAFPGATNPVSIPPGQKLPDYSTLTSNTLTSSVDLGKDEKEQTFGVSPLPAFPGATNPVSIPPGQKLPDYSTLTSNTLTSSVDLGKDEKEQTFGVSPLPAFPGATNPVSIPPGQKLPDYSTLTSNTLTSSVDLGKDEKEQTFGVSPLPAFPGATNPVSIPPGQKLPDYSTLTSNTLTSSVDLGKDEKEQTFGVSPLPAFPGATNPVSIPPGQKLPDYSTLTSDTLTSSVDLGKEPSQESNYENSPLASKLETAPFDSDDIHKVSNSLQESSINITPEPSSALESRIKENFDANPTIQSAGPLSSTANMTAGVPITKSSTLQPENISTVNLTSSSNLESINKKERTGIHDLTKSDNFVTSGQPDAENNIASEMHPPKLASLAPDEASEVANNSLKTQQTLKAVLNEDTVPKNEEKHEVNADRRSLGKPAPVIIPAGSVQRSLSQVVTPHTITTVESPSFDPEAKTSNSHSADGSNDIAGNDKANKKKKRSSFFGKLKAKLTFKDKE